MRNCSNPVSRSNPTGWSDGPLDGQTEERAYVLGISVRHEEVVACIVECAARLGLTVFDMQLAIAHLPSRKRLTQGPAAAPSAPVAPLCEALTDIRVAVYEGMLRALGEIGFVYDSTDEGCLMLRFPGGYHRIGVPLWNDYPLHYSFTFHLVTRLDEVAAIAAPLMGVSPENLDKEPCSMVGYGYLYGEAGKEYTVDSRAGLALAITEMNIVIVNKLLPLLDSISDLRGMENLFNGPATQPSFQSHKDDGFNALTLARLAGNPDYPALCARYLNAVHPGNRKLRRHLPHLIAWLDNYDADKPVPPPPFAFDDAACFVADYDGSQWNEIDVKSNGATGQAFYDANAVFRAELMREAAPPMPDFSLRLLRDLFRTEAKACTAVENFQVWTIGNLSFSLLSRGGVGELALFAECVPVSGLGTRRMSELPFPADIAESLRYACEERTSNPMFGERAVQYAALEKYFAAIAARGHQ